MIFASENVIQERLDRIEKKIDDILASLKKTPSSSIGSSDTPLPVKLPPEYETALTLFEKGDYASASLAFISVIRDHPDVYMAYIYLGECYLRIKDTKAKGCFEKALSLPLKESQKVQAYLGMLECLIDSGTKKEIEDQIKTIEKQRMSSAQKQRFEKLKAGIRA